MDFSVLSEEFLQTLYKFYRMRPQQQVNEAMHGENFALHVISLNDDAVMPSNIEGAMCVSSARVATLLNGLEKKGFITRRIDPKDKRRTILKLTKEGQVKVAEGKEQMLSFITSMLEDLGEKDARELLRITSKLSERFNDESNSCT